MPRRYLNIRQNTFEMLDQYRVEVEPDLKESWDEFFRRVVKSGILEQLQEKE